MKLLVHGAQLKCSMGTMPSKLAILPNHTSVDDAAKATAQDFVPMTNIKPFGMCKSPANPQVAAATAAHLGVLTPMPCVPKITAPWQSPSDLVVLDGVPALTDASKCACQWGGTIQPTDPGQDVVEQG